jgi:hypothetical protein
MMKKLRDQAAEKKISSIQLILLQLILLSLPRTCLQMNLLLLPLRIPLPLLPKMRSTLANLPKRSWVKHNHPPHQLLGTIDEGRRLRSRVIQPTSEVANQVSYSCYLAQTEPKKVDEAIQDEGWVSTMHDELHQFTRNLLTCRILKGV